MTIEELYNWAYDNDCEDFELVFSSGKMTIAFDEEDLEVDRADDTVSVAR